MVVALGLTVPVVAVLPLTVVGHAPRAHGFAIFDRPSLPQRSSAQMQRRADRPPDCPPIEKDPIMGTTDKARNTTQQAKGKVKEVVGNASGDDSLQREGKAEQTGANLKQAGEKVKDALKS